MTEQEKQAAYAHFQADYAAALPEEDKPNWDEVDVREAQQKALSLAIERAVAQERERCAKIAENHDDPTFDLGWVCGPQIAKRIREEAG